MQSGLVTLFPTRYCNCRLNDYRVVTGGSLVAIVDLYSV